MFNGDMLATLRPELLKPHWRYTLRTRQIRNIGWPTAVPPVVEAVQRPHALGTALPKQNVVLTFTSDGVPEFGVRTVVQLLGLAPETYPTCCLVSDPPVEIGAILRLFIRIELVDRQRGMGAVKLEQIVVRKAALHNRGCRR